MRKLLRQALEERSDGLAHRECEHTFYARIENMEDLKKASSTEHHEQWEVPYAKTDLNGGRGRMRIRKTVIGEKVEYVLTMKTTLGLTGDEKEVSIPTTEAMFEQFKLVSEKGMIKDRYHFPVEGTELVWEVDMFHMPTEEGAAPHYFDWCKIDLEVTDRNAPLPPLPLAFPHVILEAEGHRSPEDEEQVRNLYEHEFITRNKHVT